MLSRLGCLEKLINGGFDGEDRQIGFIFEFVAGLLM